MSINDTRARNLLIASKLRESGYRTAYHALRAKFPEAYNLIDIKLKDGVSLREIINEVEHAYSKELDQMVELGFGRLSIQSLSVFKNNYWINMSGLPSIVQGIPKTIVESKFKDWNSYNVLIEMASKSLEIANRTSEMDLKLPVGSEIGRKLRREAFDMAGACLEWELRLGMRRTEQIDTPESEPEHSGMSGDDELIARGEAAIAILKQKHIEKHDVRRDSVLYSSLT